MRQQMDAPQRSQVGREAAPSGTRECMRCGHAMAYLRTEEQWRQSRQYVLEWQKCPNCQTVELGRWEATDLMVETRPQPA